MKLTPRPDVAAQALAEAAARHAEERAGGIHLSDLIVCNRQSFYRKLGIGLDPDSQNSENLQTMLGRAFHAWLQFEPEKVVMYAGRWHSTDRLDEGPLPVEIKSTRYSSARHPVPHYVDQLAAYCIAHGVRKGQLWCLYLSGNYRDIREPQFIVTDVEFDEDELARWERTLGFRQAELEASLVSGNAPDINHRVDWACKYCPFKGRVCPGGSPSSATWHENFVDKGALDADI